MQNGRTACSRSGRRDNRTLRRLPPRAKVPNDQDHAHRGFEPSRWMAQFPAGSCRERHNLVGKGPSYFEIFSQGYLGTGQCTPPLVHALNLRRYAVDSPPGIGERTLDSRQIRTSSQETFPTHQWFLARPHSAPQSILSVVIDNVPSQRKDIRRHPTRLLDGLQPTKRGR